MLNWSSQTAIGIYFSVIWCVEIHLVNLSKVWNAITVNILYVLLMCCEKLNRQLVVRFHCATSVTFTFVFDHVCLPHMPAFSTNINYFWKIMIGGWLEDGLNSVTSVTCGRPSPWAGCTTEGETAIQQPGQRHRSSWYNVILSWKSFHPRHTLQTY